MSDKPAGDELVTAKVRALMIGYASRWDDSECRVLAVEKMLVSDLLNPDTGRRSRSLRIGGKLDVVMERRSKLVVIDHKTTSEDVTDPAGTYWRQLVVDAQPSHYMLLAWLSGEKLDEAMWDIIRRPSISPKQITTKAEKANIIANRRYCNRPISDETCIYLGQEGRENIELYTSRLIQNCCDERPEWYFARRTVPRLDGELMDYGRDLWEIGQIIIEARRLNRWPKHPGSCMAYSRPCPYLGICSNFDRPDSDKWLVKSQVHTELPDLDGDGRETLTFSSIRCYQTCPRKFYYRYQMGIERHDEEDSEALTFGRAIHEALEAHWEALIPQEKTHEHSNDAPGSSPADAECDAEDVPF